MKSIVFIKKAKAPIVVTILCLIGIVAVFILPVPAKENEFPLMLGIVVFGGITMLGLYAILEHKGKERIKQA